MKYTSIYKNGKIQNFYISYNSNVGTKKGVKAGEFDFLQPYYFITDIDNTKHGNIYEMNRLFNRVVIGRQYHGWGYSSSHDVYSELIHIIKKLYKDKLSKKALEELNQINTHNEDLQLSKGLLYELQLLNNAYFTSKYN